MRCVWGGNPQYYSVTPEPSVSYVLKVRKNVFALIKNRGSTCRGELVKRGSWSNINPSAESDLQSTALGI